MKETRDINRVNALPHYMLRFGHHLMRGFKHAASEKYSLNKTQMRTLVMLRRRGSHTMSEIVSHMNIEKGSMTSVVDSLLSRGLVSRERDTRDRRRVLISLLPPGREIALELEQEMESHIREQLDLLGEERVKALFQLAEIVKESLEIWENKSE